MRGPRRPTPELANDAPRVDSIPLRPKRPLRQPLASNTHTSNRPPTKQLPAFRLVALALALALASPPTAHSADLEVRLRIVWGAGAQQPHPWNGHIAIRSGRIVHVQPLGIETDEAAALQLLNDQLVINPLLPRAFDGCDATIVASPDAELLVDIQSNPNDSSDPAPNRVAKLDRNDELNNQTLHIPVHEILNQPYRAALGPNGGHILISRAPGDLLRVECDRDSLVFAPDETWRLSVSPDVPATPDELPLAIELALHHAGSGERTWEMTRTWRPGDPPLDVEINTPAHEGAYRLAITARGRQRLAHRWLLAQPPPALASRVVELVVIDPSQPVATPIKAWIDEWTIDPATPHWWQRLPAWTRVSQLPGMPGPRSLGNVAVATEPLGNTTAVVLPTRRPDGEPAWQAYTLPIRRPGWPHAIEIQMPAGQQQQLDFCLAEPDAAGRAIEFLRHASVFSEGTDRGTTSDPNDAAVQRLVFWPRTQMPVLLIANRSTKRPGYYGPLRLQAAAPPAHSAATASSDVAPGRLVAAYLASPDIIRAFGAQGRYDPTSGLAITDWNMVLTAAQRIANRLKSTGYNGAVICVAADGGSLTPAALFGNSPRFDNGRLASDGADPMPKDILEAFCRVFDRESLRLIPVVQLATPTPALEASVQNSNPAGDGLLCIDDAGQGRRQRLGSPPSNGPYYNLLHTEVQQQLIDATLKLTRRYVDHPCLAGIGMQLPAHGYGVLPPPAWGLDPATFERFAASAGLPFDKSSPSPLEDRRTQVLGPAADAWQAWRQSELTAFYQKLAARLQEEDSRLRLVLCTEQTLDGRQAKNELRKAVAGRGSYRRAWELAGLDAEKLTTTPGLLLLRPRSIGSSLAAEHRLVDRHVHQAAAVDTLCSARGNDGTLVYYSAEPLELPTFNQQSPFGAANTQLRTSATASPGGRDLRRALTEAVAANDWSVFVEGGNAWLIADDPQRRRLLSVLAALPLPSREVYTEQVQPLTMRVYRDKQKTTVCFINEAPWPIQGHWVATTQGQVEIVELGERATPPETLVAGPQSQSLQLDPYDLRAWTIADPETQIEPPVLQSTLPAQNDLARQLELLDARMQNLAIRRPYPELADPSFENGEEHASDAWQTRRGAVGDIRFDAPAYAGDRALRLISDDALGVAVQSRSFAIPETGQLIVQAAVRSGVPDAAVQLHVSIEYEQNGRLQRQHRTFGADAPLDDAWTVRELAVDDLPLTPGAQAHVQIHATGHGEVWIDEVALFDLAFSSDERIELAKRLYAARTSINEGKLLDCLRHIDSYWTQRLVENVPAPQVALAPQPPKVTPSEQKTESSRRWLPRLWR